MVSGNLGVIHQHLGHHRSAALHLDHALNLARLISTSPDALAGTSRIMYESLGRLPENFEHPQIAAAMFTEILTIARKLGDRISESNVLGDLSYMCRQFGRYPTALNHAWQALLIAREIENHLGEIDILNEYATNLRLMNSPSQAIRHHHEARALAEHLSDRYRQARAHDGIAQCHLAAGDTDAARTHWQYALDLFTDLGTPETDTIKANLDALNSRASDTRQCHR